MDRMPTLESIRRLQLDAEATYLTFGPPPDVGQPALEVVETFGPYEAEYAAIHKGAAIFDMAFRGTVELTGKDRLDLLHRLTTQDVRSLPSGQARRGFLLDKAGHIQADVVVINLADRTLLDVDLADAPAVAQAVERMVFSEDVQVRDASADFVHLGLLGPAAPKLLHHVTGQQPAAIEPAAAWLIDHRGATLVIHRRDEAGPLGLHVLTPTAIAADVYAALTEAVGGLNPDPAPGIVPGAEGQPKRTILGRGIGWMAYNTARIEAGSPLFHVDFGPDSLPHETAILSQAVSFTKGCYLGQEIVARMQSLGHPKRLLVGLRLPDDRLPIAGSQILTADSQVVGGVTSSTLSPLLGQTAIALAVVKWGRHTPGTTLRVAAEGAIVDARVVPPGQWR